MQYVAFLRGINVGGRSIKMDELKACFASLGLLNVVSYLQSGNVAFETKTQDSQTLRSQIESAVGQKFNYPAKIQVYPLETVKKVTESYPYDATDEEWQHYVLFLEDGLAAQLAEEASGVSSAAESIFLGDGVIYWRVKKGMTLDSPFAKYLTKAKYKHGNTNRNLKTLKKVIAARSL